MERVKVKLKKSCIPGCLALIPTALTSVLFSSRAAAHEGAIHRGVPHWILLGIVLLGVAVLTVTIFGRRRAGWSDKLTAFGVMGGVFVAVVGIIGLVEVQVEPRQASILLRDWYPVTSLVLGVFVLTGSLLLGWFRWRDHPRYTVLGMLLGLWIGYPTYVPGNGVRNPLGYLVVISVPVALGYIVWRDIYGEFREASGDKFAAITGGFMTVLFSVFFLFSAGLLSLNPETGVNGQMEGFFVFYRFSNPLVIWPAIEFYIPSIPLVGAISIGTALVVGVLTTLIGVNTVLGVKLWRMDVGVRPKPVGGAVATTGATACCCCAPAFYGVTSALLGASASPLYWSLIDPASPAGSLFFAGAVALLTMGAVEMSNSLRNDPK